MRFEGWWTARESILALCPYNSTCGCTDADIASLSSEYFHSRIVRSRPEDAMCDGEINLADLADEVCPPPDEDGEVASTSEDMFHILKKPS